MLTLFLAALQLPADAAPDPVSVAGIPGKLHWKNMPAASHQLEGALSITAGKSTDWYISPLDGKQSASAPILLFEPARDFTLSAKVTVDFRTKWDAGTLYVFGDGKRWAKLAFEQSVYKKPTIVSVVTRGVSDDCNSRTVAGQSVWLKVARTGDAIAFYASDDGHAWEMVRAFTFGKGQKLQAGFSAQSPVGPGVKVVFSDIHYAARKIADLFAGE